MKFETHTYSILILEKHLDTFGHVNNATYLEMLEEARWDFITARGYGFETIKKTGKGPVILGINMKFLKEIKLRQKIVIETQTISYKGKIASLRQDIFSDAGELMFEARLTFGFFDTVERKLITPSPEWLTAIGELK
jgi:YbgC/YbaW family acyl-CoA thioester hydrolase